MTEATRPTDAPSSGRQANRLTLGLILVSLAAHFSYHWAVPPRLWWDSYRYGEMACGFWGRLAGGDWDLATTPGYPILLWAVSLASSRLTAVTLVQQLLGSVTPVVLFRGLRHRLGERVAAITALLTALAPQRHYYSEALLTESLAEFLLAVCIALVLSPRVRGETYEAGRSVLAGLLLGWLVLVRPNLLAAAALLPLGYAQDRRGGWRMLSAILAVAVIVLPWVAFNEKRGVSGLTGAVGYQGTLMANAMGIGEPRTLPPLVAHTTSDERRLRGELIARYGTHPLAYARAVALSVAALVLPIRPRGDMGDAVGRSRDLPPPVALPCYDVERHALGPSARMRLHRITSPVYAVVVSLAWLGVVLAFLGAVRKRSLPDLALTAALVASVGSLALLTMCNTRYAFPLEAAAVMIGGSRLWTFIRDFPMRRFSLGV